ncbi:putative cytochrome P450 [Thozetella sp. PMI_491]|nr:putative cytochrome P450 [Thozetella sp. PMI_491]
MSLHGFFALIGWAIVLFASYVVITLFYNVFLHPCRKFPGPLATRASRMPWVYWTLKGDHAFKIHELHQRYGPVVRTAPDEVSFIDPEAWKDIYGHRVGAAVNLPEIPKSPEFYKPVKANPYSIINAPRELHAILRRGLAHGFSEKSLREQESIIGNFVTLLMSRLREQTANGEAINISKWYNFTTFDVIGELTVGNSFNCLQNSDYHPWVKLIEKTPRSSGIRIAISALGLTSLSMFVMRNILKTRVQHNALTKELLLQRIESKTERPDLIDGLLRRNGVDYGFGEIHMTASGLLLAGSETTATALTAVTYFLLKYPEVLAKVVQEVRSSFNSEDEITFLRIQKLDYMLACLNETLRLFPPVAAGLPRTVPKGGADIAGRFVPANTIVNVPHYAINHSEAFWKDPECFHPERFLGNLDFAGDRTEVMQSFSYGPRNCIGRNLAYAEMRLVLARLLYNFDLQPGPGSLDWFDRAKSYFLWQKPVLNVHLIPVRGV